MSIINSTSIQAQDISTNPDVTIQFLAAKPIVGATLAIPEPPGKLYGYYDQAIGAVRMYAVDPTGRRYVSI